MAPPPHDSTLTLGVICTDGLLFLLEQVAQHVGLSGSDELTDGAVFVDLGSGDGGAVLSAASRWCRLQASVGVEIVEERHATAIEQLSSLRSRAAEEGTDMMHPTRAQLDDDSDALSYTYGRIRFICGDIFDVPIGELVPPLGPEAEPRRFLFLLNSLCFDRALHLKALQKVVCDVDPEDEVFIMTTKILEDLSPSVFGRSMVQWYEAPIRVSWATRGAVVQVLWLPPPTLPDIHDLSPIVRGKPLHAARELLRNAPLPPLWHGSRDDGLGAVASRASNSAAKGAESARSV